MRECTYTPRNLPCSGGTTALERTPSMSRRYNQENELAHWVENKLINSYRRWIKIEEKPNNPLCFSKNLNTHNPQCHPTALQHIQGQGFSTGMAIPPLGTLHISWAFHLNISFKTETLRKAVGISGFIPKFPDIHRAGSLWAHPRCGCHRETSPQADVAGTVWDCIAKMGFNLTSVVGKIITFSIIFPEVRNALP